MALVLQLLIALAPVITQAGLGLINWFFKGQADKEQASKNFLAAIQAHLDDALLSVNSRYGAQQQNEELDKLQATLDKVQESIDSQVSPPTPKV